MRDTRGHTRVHSISCTGGHALCTRGHVGPRWAKMPRPARKPRREPPRGEPGAGPGRRGRSRRARGAPSRAPGAPPPSSSRFGGRDSSPPFPLRRDALFGLPSWRGGERRCRGPPPLAVPPTTAKDQHGGSATCDVRPGPGGTLAVSADPGTAPSGPRTPLTAVIPRTVLEMCEHPPFLHRALPT